MGIGEIFSKIYAGLENGFYKIMDFFETRGVPVYNYNDFLENKGIPVFPFTAGIIVLVLALLWVFVVGGFGGGVALTPRFVDGSGNTVNEVLFTVIGSDGKQAFSETIDSGQKVFLQGVELGETITILAQKEGYSSEPVEGVKIDSREAAARIELEEEKNILNAQLRLVDPNGTIVRNAIVVAEFGDRVVEGSVGEDGIVVLQGVPEGESVSLNIRADNYEQEVLALGFESGNVREIELAPEASALQGNALVVFRAMDADSKNLVGGVEIKLFDKESGEQFAEEVDNDGEYSAEIEKGKSIRWVVGSEGYISFDSGEREQFLTVRGDESIAVYLQKGGKKVVVSVVDKQAQTLLGEAVVSLYNSFGELVDRNVSGFGGFVEFKDLDAGANYYASAFKEGYVVSSTLFSPMEGVDVRVELEQTNSSTGATASVFVARNDVPVEGAVLSFFEIRGVERVPQGVPDAVTDFAGYFGATVPIGINLQVVAAKDGLKGDGNVVVEALSLNKVIIDLAEAGDAVTLEFEDEAGLPINDGKVMVFAGNGDKIFEGELEAGKASFLPFGNRNVIVRFEGLDGEVFEEEINTEVKKEQKISVGKKTAHALAPEITLLRIEDAAGNEVESIAKGKEGFLVFETVWPEGKYNGGMHVRVGSDAVKNAESQDIWVVGASNAGGVFYGRTYNASPAPGNEAIDLENNGRAGERNKFVELYFESPEGTKIVKVRVKASEEGGARQELHYRAWAQFLGNYYRNPEDSVIGTKLYSENRHALYAETASQEIIVADSMDGTCSKEICISYRFLDSGENFFEPENFKPEKEKNYALDVAVYSKQDSSFSVSASTNPENPRIGFMGIDLIEPESIAPAFAEGIGLDTSAELKTVPINKGEYLKARIYFQGKEAGEALLKVQVNAESAPLVKDFRFKVFEYKKMSVKVLPESAEIGENFAVQVLGEEGKGIANAAIVLRELDGKTLRTIIGTGSRSNGKNGVYEIKNTFNAGEILVEVSAEGYAPATLSYVIAKMGIIKLPEELYVPIKAEEKTARIELELENKSVQPIESITIEKIGSNENFELLEIGPVGSLAPRQSRKIALNAAYAGALERENAEFVVSVAGIVAGKYPTKASTRVLLDYNPEFDPSCLQITPGSLKVALVNEAGALKEIKIKAKNTCASDLLLIPRAEQKGSRDLGTNVFAEEISIKKDEEKVFTIEIENSVGRSGYSAQNIQYSIIYSSPELSKALPLDITLWNKRFALQAPDFIELYVSQTGTQRATSSSPLYVRNIGNSVIENLSIGLGDSYLNDFDYYKGLEPDYYLDRQQVEGSVPSYLVDKTSGEQLYRENDYVDSGVASQALQASYPGIGNTYNSISRSGIDYGGFSGQIGSLYNDARYGNTYNDARFLYSSPTLNYSNLFSEPMLMRPSSELEGVSVRIEPKSTYVVLPPGQAMFPPPLVVASTSAAKSKTVRQRLVIEGTIDGIAYPLKTVEVVVHVSAPNCLKVSPAQLELGPEELGTGFLTESFYVKNECSEEARIVDALPKDVAGNTVAIEGAGNIPIGGTVRMQLNVLKQREADVASQLRLFGAFVRSGKRVETEPITVSLRVLGKGAEGIEEGPLGASLMLPSCEDEKQKIEVKMPKLSLDKDCSTGFCDAVQLAEFLAGKIAKKVEEMENTARSKNYDATDCMEPGACKMLDLGVKPETITIYLANDQLAPQMLAKVMEADKYSAIKGFRVEYSGITGHSPKLLDIVAGKGYGRQILLPEFRGCGKYVARIDAAIETAAGRIQSGRETVLVYLTQERRTVSGCENEVQNILNFLPQDAGTGIDSAKGSWPGTVDSEQSLTEEAGIIAAEFFEEKSSRYKQGSTSNKLYLSKGLVAQGIMEIEMPVDSGEPIAPKKIGVKIREDLLGGTKTEMQERIKEIARIVAGFKTGTFGEGSCITADRKKFVARSARESVGAIVLSDCVPEAKEKGKKEQQTTKADELSVFAGTESCCKFTVTGNIKGQMVGLKVLEKEAGEKHAGIDWENTVFRDAKERKIVENLITLETKKETVESVLKEVHQKELLLCTQANAKYYAEIAIKEPELTIVAKDESKIGSGMETTNKVLAKACPIHPFELMQKLSGESKKLSAKEEKEFYAVLAWEGPDNVNLGQLELAVMEDQRLAESLGGTYFAGAMASPTLSRAGRESVGKLKASSVGAYFGVCAVSHGLIDGLLGLVTGGWGLAKLLIDIPVDCGIPAGIGIYEVHEEYFAGTPIISSLGSAIDYGLEAGVDYAASKGLVSKEKAEEAKMLVAGTLSSMFRGIISPMKNLLWWREPTTSFEIPSTAKGMQTAVEDFQKKAVEKGVLESKLSKAKTGITTVESTHTRKLDSIAKNYPDAYDPTRRALEQSEIASFNEELAAKQKALESATEKFGEAEKALKESSEQAARTYETTAKATEDGLKETRKSISEQFKVDAEKLKGTPEELEKQLEKALQKKGIPEEARKKTAKAYRTLVEQKQFLDEMADGTTALGSDFADVKSASAGRGTSTLADRAKELAKAGETIESGVRSSSLSRFKDWFGATKKGRFIRGGLSVGSGIFSNIVAYNFAQNFIATGKLGGKVETKCVGGTCFLKNFAYKVTVSEKDGAYTWAFEQVTDTKSVPSNASFIKPLDCKAAFERELKVKAGAVAVAENPELAAAEGKAIEPEAETSTEQTIVANAQKHGVNPVLALAVAGVESNYRQEAKSGAGAVGVMQIMPQDGTAGEECLNAGIIASYNELAESEEKNIECGAYHLSQLQKKCKTVEGTLRAYHGGTCTYTGPKTDQYVVKVEQTMQHIKPA